MDNERTFTSKYIINHLPPDQREFLLRKRVQDVISRFAGVKVVTRGFHIKPRHDGSMVLDNRLPLQLFFIGPSKRNLTLAVQKIQSLIKNPRLELSDNEEEEFIDTERITIGIDVFPSIFRMKSKMLGEKNENVEYILNETGSVITLRGKGSGFYDERNPKEAQEPLHVHVRYKSKEIRDKTRELILNLVDTVQQDFISAYGKYYPRPRKPEIIPVTKFNNSIRRASSHNSLPGRSPIRSLDRSLDRRSSERRSIENRSLDRRSTEDRILENRSNDRPIERPLDSEIIETNKPTPPPPVNDNISSNIEKITVGLESVPSSFNLKSKIYGPNLANVKHIEKVASALLLVEGKGCGVDSKGEESQDPPYILVKYLKPELRETARGLIFNLIDTIQQEFVTLYGRYPIDPQKPQIVPIKKLMNDKMNRPSSISSIQNQPDEVTPVPPPPPVISKPISPDGFDNVPPPIGYANRPKPVSPIFSNPEPTPVPRPIPSLAPPIIPALSSFETRSFDRLPEPIVHPLPVNPPIPRIGPQLSLLSSVLSPQNRILLQPPPTFATSTETQAQIQTIQYNKKRPKSPIEPFSEPKKFCSGINETSKPNAFNVSANTSTATPVQTGQSSTSKGKIGFSNRYLVPVQVNSKATMVHTDLPKEQPKPLTSILKKPQWKDIRNGKDQVKSDSEEEDERKSIILIDSEEEEVERQKKNSTGVTTFMKNNGANRDVAIQTDDKLWQWQIKNIKCACGKFSHVLTGVRSVGVQTIGVGRF